MKRAQFFRLRIAVNKYGRHSRDGLIANIAAGFVTYQMPNRKIEMVILELN